MPALPACLGLSLASGGLVVVSYDCAIDGLVWLKIRDNMTAAVGVLDVCE
jgi:hypothetical protein